MNTTSSRSHAIFTIELKHYSPSNSLPVTTSTLNIIDLAGSERSKNNHLDRLAEAGSINRSLMVLGQCIEVLKKNQHHKPETNGGNNTGTSHSIFFKAGVHGSNGLVPSNGTWGTGTRVVPFRQNKLTELLFGNVMKGSKCVMIVNLNMGTSFEENVGVLRYASLAHEIEALPASELGGTMSRSSSGDVRSDGMEPFSLDISFTVLFFCPLLGYLLLQRCKNILFISCYSCIPFLLYHRFIIRFLGFFFTTFTAIYSSVIGLIII